MKNRNEKLLIRFTHKEKEHLKKQAEIVGYKMEPFIRALVAGSNLQPKPPIGKAELLAEINYIGHNINQVVTSTHIAKSVSSEAMSELVELLNEVYDKVKGL